MKNCRLEGIRFGLFDSCGRQLATGCTNRNGEIDFEGLPMGRYFVQQLNNSSEFEGERNCREVIIDCNGRCQTVEFENVQRLGGIRVMLWGRTENCRHENTNRCNCNSGCNNSSRCNNSNMCNRCNGNANRCGGGMQEIVPLAGSNEAQFMDAREQNWSGSTNEECGSTSWR
ncbi:MAG: prealbumin-like fold domain-containing protein [Clostridiales bacterium]|nr:prealbumin-like fold domain-containing protein [Clostridiales bacterium]